MCHFKYVSKSKHTKVSAKANYVDKEHIIWYDHFAELIGIEMYMPFLQCKSSFTYTAMQSNLYYSIGLHDSNLKMAYILKKYVHNFWYDHAMKY